jgi:phenylpyruvate tautomerase PptA (4-oxalocrotonate tautomerase family)
MPVIRVTVVGDRAIAHDAARRLADGVGRILGSQPGTVWVLIEKVAAEHYAENNAEHPPEPVLLQLLLREGVTALQPGQVEALCGLAHAVLHVPAQHVHLIVEPAAAGRVYFGGVAGG